jgi:hypothetical protein
MKNLNEEIKKIKHLMLFNEQCAGTDPEQLEQCEGDLEDNGYTVYNPSEKRSVCDENKTIKCVSEILKDKGIEYSVSSTQSSTKDCFVLGKSKKKEGGLVKYHFTFYSDDQVVFTALMNNNNDSDLLLYRGKFECDESSKKLTINNLIYKGIWVNSSTKPEFDKKVKNINGDPINIDTSNASTLNINSGDLKYPDYLTYVYNFNVKNKNIDIDSIVDLLK